MAYDASEKSWPSPPRLDPLRRTSPSRGPLSRSTKSSSSARPGSAARPAVSAEGLRDLVHARATAGALLQCGVPHDGHALAPLEGAAALLPHRPWSGLSLRADATLATTSPRAACPRRHRSSLVRPRVGHRPARTIQRRAIGQAVTSRSRARADPRCSDSARGPVGAHWNG